MSVSENTYGEFRSLMGVEETRWAKALHYACKMTGEEGRAAQYQWWRSVDADELAQRLVIEQNHGRHPTEEPPVKIRPNVTSSNEYLIKLGSLWLVGYDRKVIPHKGKPMFLVSELGSLRPYMLSEFEAITEIIRRFVDVHEAPSDVYKPKYHDDLDGVLVWVRSLKDVPPDHRNISTKPVPAINMLEYLIKRLAWRDTNPYPPFPHLPPENRPAYSTAALDLALVLAELMSYGQSIQAIMHTRNRFNRLLKMFLCHQDSEGHPLRVMYASGDFDLLFKRFIATRVRDLALSRLTTPT